MFHPEKTFKSSNFRNEEELKDGKILCEQVHSPLFKLIEVGNLLQQTLQVKFQVSYFLVYIIASKDYCVTV